MASGSPWRGVAVGWPFCPPGADPALHRRLDGALDVGPRPGPRQLLHPVLDSPGGPSRHRAPGTQLPRPLAHWGPRHRCQGLARSLNLLSTFLHFLFEIFWGGGGGLLPPPPPHSTLPSLSRTSCGYRILIIFNGNFYTLSQVCRVRIQTGQMD